MQDVWMDLRQAVRSLLRARGFLVTAAICLALGIGSNLAVISQVDQRILRPLPFPDPARLVIVEPWDGRTGVAGPMTMADFLDLQGQCRQIQGMGACTSRFRTLLGAGEPLRVNVGMVTANFFPLLGVKPVLGRVAFRPDEEVAPATVGILSHAFWMSRFGGDPGVLGRTLDLDGKAVQVVGVLPADFRFYKRISESQVFTPEATPFAGRTNRGMGTFLTVGRLRPGASIPQAQAEARGVAGRMAATVGAPTFDVRVSSLLERTVEGYKRVLLLFQGAVALLLLITCFNVAGLQLVRDMARGRDLAIRQALGAGGGRMGRLFLAESLFLALLGGAIGLALNLPLQRGMGWIMTDFLPAPEPRLYPALVGAALALVLATALCLAFLSWFMARRPRLVETLKAGYGASPSRAHGRVLKGLVVSEVALSVVLLLGAGLMIHSLRNLLQEPPGFDARHVLTVRVPLPPRTYDLETQKAFLHRLDPALKALPGVGEVGVNDTLPFVKAHNNGNVGTTPRDARGRDGGRMTNARWHVVTAGYFKTLGIPLLAGEILSPTDPRACMISRRLAERLWPGQDPIGRPAFSGMSDPYIVAGVVGDTAENSLTAKEEPQFYVSAEANKLFEGPVVALKVKGDPARYAAQVKATIRSLDPALAVADPKPLEEALRESMNLQTVASVLFSIFGGLAMLLAALGLYGVLTQITMQKRREIGIRMSLGASRSHVVGGILKGAASLVALGMAVGCFLGWELGKALRPILFGLTNPGPLVYLGVLTVLALAAFVACMLPALRAVRGDPMEALRQE